MRTKGNFSQDICAVKVSLWSLANSDSVWSVRASGEKRFIYLFIFNSKSQKVRILLQVQRVITA